MQRGEVREKPEEEAPLPRWTPFPANSTMNRLRKAILLELGLFSIVVYVIIFLNAMVLCLDSADASDRRERVLSYVRGGTAVSDSWNRESLVDVLEKSLPRGCARQ